MDIHVLNTAILLCSLLTVHFASNDFHYEVAMELSRQFRNFEATDPSRFSLITLAWWRCVWL